MYFPLDHSGEHRRSVLSTDNLYQRIALTREPFENRRTRELNLFALYRAHQSFTIHSSMYLVSKTLRSIGIPFNRSNPLCCKLFFHRSGDRSSVKAILYLSLKIGILNYLSNKNL